MQSRGKIPQCTAHAHHLQTQRPCQQRPLLGVLLCALENVEQRSSRAQLGDQAGRHGAETQEGYYVRVAHPNQHLPGGRRSRRVRLCEKARRALQTRDAREMAGGASRATAFASTLASSSKSLRTLSGRTKLLSLHSSAAGGGSLGEIRCCGGQLAIHCQPACRRGMQGGRGAGCGQP